MNSDLTRRCLIATSSSTQKVGNRTSPSNQHRKRKVWRSFKKRGNRTILMMALGQIAGFLCMGQFRDGEEP